MERERERLIEDLFQQVLDLSAADRDGFLATACGGDQDLRNQVETLLRSCEIVPSRFLAGVRDDGLEGEANVSILDGMVGRRIGRYELLRVIASGGMGTVYEARQEQPHRTVAVKLIRQGFTSGANVRRFLNEADVLGRLSHPGIAHVFEAGVHREAGGVLPFFAMEHLPGAVALTTYADLPPRVVPPSRLVRPPHSLQAAGGVESPDHGAQPAALSRFR